jgi:hypothetical protein
MGFAVIWKRLSYRSAPHLSNPHFPLAQILTTVARQTRKIVILQGAK